MKAHSSFSSSDEFEVIESAWINSSKSIEPLLSSSMTSKTKFENWKKVCKKSYAHKYVRP